MKGNIAINKSIAKGIENGKIIQKIPEVQSGGRMVPLFTPISPIQCSICGSTNKSWVKSGWRKFLESQLGRKLTNREWKKLRYQVIYVVAAEEKVILDFEITNRRPSYLELVPLMNRIKNRIPEEQLQRIVFHQ